MLTRAGEQVAAQDGNVEPVEGDGAGGAEGAVDERKDTSDLAFGLGVGGAVVAGGIAATWALSEHASTGIQPGIAMPVDILHLLAVATWLGGLAALLVALYKIPGIEREAVRRFSQVAFLSVLVLVVTGVYQSWRQLGSWSALTGTSYGRLLLIKIALVGVLVGIAYLSRSWTARLSDGRTEAAQGDVSRETQLNVSRETSKREAAPAEAEVAEAEVAEAALVTVPADPRRVAQLARQRTARENARSRQVRDADPGRAGLRRSVLAEAAVAIALLAVTTVLTNTEPGRTAELETGRGSTAATAVPNRPIKITLPFDTGGPQGKGTIRLELAPGRVGANGLHLWAENPDGQPLDLPEVKVSFTLPSRRSVRCRPFPTARLRDTGARTAYSCRSRASGASTSPSGPPTSTRRPSRRT